MKTNLKYFLIALSAFMLANCKPPVQKEGTIISVALVNGTETKSTSTTSVGVGITSDGAVPVVATGSTSYEIPCEYGLLNIDLDGDGLIDESIKIKLTSKRAVHYFRARQILENGDVAKCFYTGPYEQNIDSIASRKAR